MMKLSATLLFVGFLAAPFRDAVAAPCKAETDPFSGAVTVTGMKRVAWVSSEKWMTYGEVRLTKDGVGFHATVTFVEHGINRNTPVLPGGSSVQLALSNASTLDLVTTTDSKPVFVGGIDTTWPLELTLSEQQMSDLGSFDITAWRVFIHEEPTTLMPFGPSGTALKKLALCVAAA